MDKQLRGRAPRKELASDIIHSVRLRLLSWPRGLKQAAMVAADALSYSAAVVMSLWLVSASVPQVSSTLTILLLAITVALPVHFFFGLYASIVRYMGVTLLAIGLRATFIVSLIVSAAGAGLGLIAAPVRVGIIFWAFALIMVVGGRITARMFLNRRNRNRERVVIFGAGAGGAQLTEALFSGDDYLPVALGIASSIPVAPVFATICSRSAEG